MKIIKVGNLKENQEINKVCHKCDTEFSYNNSDINQDRDGRYVNCPVCKVFISV